MTPRDPSLPEGTDHIIDTNIDLGDTGGGSGGSAGGAGGRSTGTGGGAMGGGTGATAGGTAGSTGSTGATGGGSGGSAFRFDQNAGGSSSGGGSGGGFSGQIRDQINTLKGQAGERARGFAEDGKRQTTDFLQTIAQIVGEAAGSVEDRLGSQYSGFGHRASDSITSLASRLDERSVDDLMEDARAFVQRSPAVAIGVATVVGFAIARVARSSIAQYNSENSGTSDMNGSTGGSMGGMQTGTTGASTGGMGAGASGGYDATSGGFGQQGVGTAGSVVGTGTSTGPGSTGGTGNAPTI